MDNSAKIFAGKVALVTGAGGGIGNAIALKLAADGARVGVADIDIDRARETVEEVRAAGGEAEAIRADLCSEVEVKGMVAQTVAVFGRLDILVNNATESRQEFFRADHDFMTVPAEVWDANHAVNSRGAMFASRAAILEMRKVGGGSIVNVVSPAGMTGMSILAAYGASKAAQISLTRHIATQFGKENIRCNGVAPGLTLHKRLLKIAPEMAHIPTDMVLLNYHTHADDVANAVSFLASDAARCITGHIIPVDGGSLAGRWAPKPEH